MTIDQPARIRPEWATEQPTPATTSHGIIEEFERETRFQVRRVSVSVAGIVLGLGLVWAIGSASGWLKWHGSWLVPALSSFVFMLSALLARMARDSRFSVRRLVQLSFVFSVVLTAVGALGHTIHELETYGVVTAFGVHILPMLLFSILLPSPPRVALLAALFSTLSVPLGVYGVELLGFAQLDESTYFNVLTVPIACSALSYFISSTTYGMRRAAARADRLGSYELETLLGEGGMGQVWQARHHILKRGAAVKLIQTEQLKDVATRNAALARFHREALATAFLDSPHIVRLYDFGVTEDNQLFYVMELIKGVDLENLVARHGAQPPARVKEVIAGVCDALHEAHRAGLIHRDIKPANIMVCPLGRTGDMAKVLDFGVVAIDQPRNTVQPDGDGTLLIGTPDFMAPEAFSGHSDARTDIYALGCVAFWLLTGTRMPDPSTPLAEEELVGRLRAVAKEALPEPFAATIVACLQRDPDRRPQTAAELAKLLDGCTFSDPWTPDLADLWWHQHHAALLSSNDNAFNQSALATTATARGAPNPAKMA